MSKFFEEQKKRHKARDAKIRALLIEGRTRPDIERKLDLSRQRLAQIIMRLRAEDSA